MLWVKLALMLASAWTSLWLSMGTGVLTRAKIQYFAKMNAKQQVIQLLDTSMINKAAHSCLQLPSAACQITSTSAAVQDRALLIYSIRASC